MIAKSLMTIPVLSFVLVAADTLVSLDRGNSYEMSRPNNADYWSARIFATRAKGFEKKPVTATLLGASVGVQTLSDAAAPFENPTAYETAGELAGFDVLT